MATIDDFGGSGQALDSPPLGGPNGWAKAVRDAIRNLEGGGVDTTALADGAVTSAKIAADDLGNGLVLTADSGEPSGMKWSAYGIADLDIGTVDTGSPAAASMTGNPEDGYELNLTLPPVGDGSISNVSINADAAIDRSKIAGTALTAETMGVFHVEDFGADPTGVTDSTTAIQSALDACQANGGGEVRLGIGSYKISGNGLQVKGADLVGAGIKHNQSTAGSALVGADQTGPVVTVSSKVGVFAGVAQFWGRRRLEGFSIVGDGVNDQPGLFLDEGNMTTLSHLVIRNTVGVPFRALDTVDVFIEEVILNEPVDVYANDTFYAHLSGCNSFISQQLLLKGNALLSNHATVGPSGAMMINDGSYVSEQNNLRIITEDLTVAEGTPGLIIHRGNGTLIDAVIWDSHNHTDEVYTTLWAGVVLQKPEEVAQSKGGNCVTGQLIGTFDNGNDWFVSAWGVRIEQDGNAVKATPDYPKNSVYIAAGCHWNHVELLGTRWKAIVPLVVDDSGGQGNVIIDGYQNKFIADRMSFFGVPVTTRPVVAGVRGTSVATNSLLTGLDALGLIDDTTTFGPGILTGTGSPEGYVDGVPGTVYTQTDSTVDVKGWIRWIKVSGGGSTGWQVSTADADTGWRDVSLLLQNSWAGTVYLRRVGSLVHSVIYSMKGAATFAKMIDLPTGFTSGSELTAGSTMFREVDMTGGSAWLQAYAGVLPFAGGMTDGTAWSADHRILSAGLSWSAAGVAWPTSLPGSAA